MPGRLPPKDKSTPAAKGTVAEALVLHQALDMAGTGKVRAIAGLHILRAKNSSAAPPSALALPAQVMQHSFEFGPILKPVKHLPLLPTEYDGLVPLAALLCTDALFSRPLRLPDYKAENQALLALAQALADAPRTILQALSDTALKVCHAGSAGISLLTADEQSFYCPAMAGLWQTHIGALTPRNFGPCFDALDLDTPLLFKHFERRYAYLIPLAPAAHEALLVPFYVRGKAVGCLWVLAHDDRRMFDAEDLRQLESLGRFAAAAHQAVASFDDTLGLMEAGVLSRRKVAKLDAKLVESGRLYAALFDSLDEGFCIIEKIDGGAGSAPDFRYVQANPAFAIQSGLNDVVGKSVWQVTPVEAEEWCLIYDNILLTGKPARFTCALAGAGRLLELSAARVEDETRQRIGVSLKDVTGRNRTEELLCRNYETFSGMIENAPFGVYVVDAQLRLWQASKASLKTFENISPLIGRDFAEIMHTLWPDGFASEAIRRFRQTLETGVPYSAPSLTEQRLNTHAVESYDWNIERITLPDGQFGVVCYFYDITERKAAETALRYRTTQFETLLNEAPLGVYLVDNNFRICQANPIARDTLKRIPDLIGRDFEDAVRVLYPKTVADKVVKRFRHTLDTGEACEIAQWVEERNDGRPSACYEWQINRIALPDGRYGVVCYFRDISARVQRERQLRDAEERYRHLFTSTDEGYCIIELIFDARDKAVDFRFLEVNLAFSKQSGMHDVVGKRVRELNPDLEEHWFETCGKVALTGEAVRYVNESKSMGGRWFDLYAFRVGDAHSRKVAVLFRNVKERQEAEQALRESEERYRNLFNSMDEGFCIIEMIFDTQQKAIDYRFLEANPAFEKQSGMHAVVGRRVRELIPDLEESLFEIYGRVALTGLPIRFVSEVKGLNRWLDIYAARLGETPGSRVAVTFSNITERTRVEEALRRSEERFRALFDNGPLAMYTVDATGTVQEYNQVAATLWGREPRRGDVKEKFCGSYRLYRPDGSVLLHGQTPVAAVLKGETSFAHDVEVIMERPDGSRINVIANIVPLKSAEGKITGAINCLYDTTARSLLERRTHEQAETLADLHRRKDEFLAMLSHELRSPLAPIANSLQLLRLQKNEEPLQRQARNVIERQVGQLKHLVDDLLEVSRITSGRVQLRREQIDARGILESAVETTRPLIMQKRHTLDVSLPAQPVWLHADGARLEQVMVNLLTNAAKYTDEGGRICLSVVQEGDTAVIRVKDNGIGIAPELLPRVFDLFTQADRSLDRSQGGLGIGLSLVRQLIDLHDGTVTAASIVGQGSEFTLRLPLLQTLPQECSPPSGEPAGHPGNHCRVLVVDDNVDAAHSLVSLLELSGHETRMAHDGPGALKAALAWRPDVVLLDIGLPGLNGFEVARQIRGDTTLAGMLLVALTGYGQEADRRRSQDAGFDHHLVKPADFNEVEKILARVPQKPPLQ